jgi:hypothetical protein
MGPVVVVLRPPALDNDLGLEQGAEFLDVEQLVADTAVEALGEGSPTASRVRCRWWSYRSFGTSPSAPRR